MKASAQISKILNAALGIFYIPFALYNFLLIMGTEIAIGKTDILLNLMADIYGASSFINGLLCIAVTFLAIILRERKQFIFSILVQLLPLAVFGLNILLLSCMEARALIVP